MRAHDNIALETLLLQALETSDRLEHDRVGAHLAGALDALRHAAGRPRPRPAPPLRMPCHPVRQ